MKIKTSFLTVALSSLIGIPCIAAPLQPALGINGNAEVGVTPSGTQFIRFGGFPVGPPYMPSPLYGTFEVSLVNPAIFAANGVVPGEFGMIQSLNSATTPVGVPLNPDPTNPADLPFMKFSPPPGGGGNLQVFL